MASVYGKEWPGLSVASAVCAKYSFRERAGKASRGGWDRVRVLGREEWNRTTSSLDRQVDEWAKRQTEWEQ